MQVQIRVSNDGSRFFLIVNKDDTVEDLKEKIIKTKIKEITHRTHDFRLLFDYKNMENDKKLAYYNIKNNYSITMLLTDSPIGAGAGFIDNLKEESKTPIAKKIGFDMNLIKRNELNININSF